MAAVCIAIVVTFVVSILSLVVKSQQNLEIEMNTLADVTALNSAAALLFLDQKAASNTLSALSAQHSILPRLICPRGLSARCSLHGRGRGWNARSLSAANIWGCCG